MLTAHWSGESEAIVLVKDAFVINESYGTGHAPGLVVVLDALVTRDPSWLVGSTAWVRVPSGKEFKLRIDEAKDHGSVNSLFFGGLSVDTLPVGSELTITIPLTTEQEPEACSLAS